MHKSKRRRNRPAVPILLLLLVGCGCRGITLKPKPTAVAPAAKPNIEIEQDKNGNARIEVEVEHLAPPERLESEDSIYVLWAVGTKGQNMNLGRLTVDRDRRGALVTKTPLRKFRLILTAEQNATVQRPSANVVFRTREVSVQ